jgi:NAD(P)-dependent dehydrogenase (short-subunit alcohol dehydrogenase family)
MSKLQGKTAVITGGSSGIGLATAQLFLREGANVVIAARSAQTLHEAKGTLGAGNVLAIKADVSDTAQLDALFAQTKRAFGKVDVLFVNAGVAQLGGIGEVSEARFDAQMGINFKGAYFTIQKALPVMNDGGSIILNGSVNAYVGFAGASVYSASKAALHSLARTLSAELAPRKIRVNTLTIGPINTPLWAKTGLPQATLQGFAEGVSNKITVKRFGEADEVARAALFLASDDSSFVVGSEITTDGGMLLNAL